MARQDQVEVCWIQELSRPQAQKRWTSAGVDEGQYKRAKARGIQEGMGFFVRGGSLESLDSHMMREAERQQGSKATIGLRHVIGAYLGSLDA